MVANAVNLYDCADLSAGVSKRLPLKGVAGCALCPAPGARPLLAAYVPEAKGSPGFIALYDCSALVAGGDAPPPLCRKSFYRVGGLVVGCGWMQRQGLAQQLLLPRCRNAVGWVRRYVLYCCNVLNVFLPPLLAAARLPVPLLLLPQANAAQLMWNASGTAVLALTSADVDATNQVGRRLSQEG